MKLLKNKKTLGGAKRLAMGIVILSIMIIMTAIWTIDVSTGCIWQNKVYGTEMGLECDLTNGFWSVDPVQMYHMALWLLVVSSFALASVTIFSLIRYDGVES